MSAESDLRSRFIRDTKERLGQIRDVAVDLGGDALIDASVELVRSQAHTIRGAAGMLDFEEVRNAAGKLEDAAAAALETGGEVAGEALSAALEGLGSVVDAL